MPPQDVVKALAIPFIPSLHAAFAWFAFMLMFLARSALLSYTLAVEHQWNMEGQDPQGHQVSIPFITMVCPHSATIAGMSISFASAITNMQFYFPTYPMAS
jgi:hypothetical protein